MQNIEAKPSPQTAAAPEPAARPPDLHIHLRKIPLLSQLTDEEMARVKADIRIRGYAKREVVLHKGGSLSLIHI